MSPDDVTAITQLAPDVRVRGPADVARLRDAAFGSEAGGVGSGAGAVVGAGAGGSEIYGARGGGGTCGEREAHVVEAALLTLLPRLAQTYPWVWDKLEWPLETRYRWCKILRFLDEDE